MQSLLFCFVVCFISNALTKDLPNESGCSKNNQTFKEGDHFKYNRLRYQCKDGIMQLLGCYDDNGKDIEADQDFRDKNNFKYHCYRKGPIVGYSYVPEKDSVEATKLRANLTKSTEVGKTNEQCLKNGETFKEGELYRDNHLRYKCTSGVMHVLGCYDDAGKEVNPGEEFLDKNKLRYHCYRKGLTVGYMYLPTISGSNNTETSGQTQTPKTCLHHSGEYKDGQEYRKDFLRWKCEYGIMTIKGCYDYNNKDIEVGQNFEDEQKNTFHCYKKDKRIGYYWVPKEKEASKN
uniref:Abnormal cell migration protein 18-like fibronectin type I domain-containing protein n=1 Tax=Acrobeloides nanus TaxID=290746 RepID=A0A914DQE9_9BILA